MSYEIEKKLNKVQVQSLTETEKNSLWLSIASKQKDTQKSLLVSLFSKKYMISTIVALIIVLGGGGVAVASDDAIPGDVLYPVDQAIENMHIRFISSEDKKNELKVRFAEERLDEVEKVIQQKGQSVDDVNQIEFKSEKQKQEFEGSISSVSDFVANSNISQEERDRLNTTLSSIMALLAVNPNIEIEMRTSDGVKIEVEDGEIEIETKTNSGKSDSDNDDWDDDFYETETNDDGRDISISELPSQSLNYIQNNFPNTTIVEVEKYSNYFNVYLTNGLELYFNQNGQFLRLEHDQDDNDNDDNDDNDQDDNFDEDDSEDRKDLNDKDDEDEDIEDSDEDDEDDNDNSDDSDDRE